MGYLTQHSPAFYSSLGKPSAAPTTTTNPPMSAIKPPRETLGWATIAPPIESRTPATSTNHHPPPTALRAGATATVAATITPRQTILTAAGNTPRMTITAASMASASATLRATSDNVLPPF